MDPKVGLKGKPLGFGYPRLLWIGKGSVEPREELRDELEHFDDCEVFPNTTSTAHPKLV